jgi:hypothetical protein
MVGNHTKHLREQILYFFHWPWRATCCLQEGLVSHLTTGLAWAICIRPTGSFDTKISKWQLKWNSQLAKATLISLIEVCITGVGRCWDAIWLASHSSVWNVPRFDAQYNLGCINFHVAKWPSGRNCLSYLNSCPWNYPIWNLLIPADNSQHVLTDSKIENNGWSFSTAFTVTPSQLRLTSWSQAQTERLQT